MASGLPALRSDSDLIHGQGDEPTATSRRCSLRDTAAHAVGEGRGNPRASRQVWLPCFPLQPLFALAYRPCCAAAERTHRTYRPDPSGGRKRKARLGWPSELAIPACPPAPGPCGPRLPVAWTPRASVGARRLPEGGRIGLAAGGRLRVRGTAPRADGLRPCRLTRRTTCLSCLVGRCAPWAPGITV